MAKIPTTPSKVDKYLPPPRERAPETPREPRHYQEGPSMGPARMWEPHHDGWSNEGPMVLLSGLGVDTSDREKHFSNYSASGEYECY